MNITAWNVSAAAPALVAVVVQITVLLLVTTAAARWVARNPAARHTILLWGLLSAGLIPLLVVLSGIHSIGPVLAAPREWVPPSVARAVARTFTPDPAIVLPPPRQFSPAVFILGIWAGGGIVMLLRLLAGLRVVWSIRRSASLMESDPQLLRFFGRRLPQVLLSSRLSTPIAIGIVHPAIVLPQGLIPQLSDEQRLQVLVHECAHAVRRDPLVGLYQRVLAAVFWFHPLVHWANRMLESARQDLCDNYVLTAAAPADYAATLLTIAQSVGGVPDEIPALGLIGSASDLELRIAGLLSKRRCTMTRLTRWKWMAVIGGLGVLGLVIWAFCLGAWYGRTPAMLVVPDSNPSAPSATLALAVDSRKDWDRQARDFDLRHPPLPIPAAFPQVVPFVLGQTTFATGDNITLTEVRGPTETMTVGQVYQIKGTYTLASHATATMAVYVTAKQAIDGIGNPQSCQSIQIQRGQNGFTLVLPMRCEGWPHVAMYADGKNIDNVYFGTADTVLKQ